MSKTSPTTAGPSNGGDTEYGLREAINQVFTLFRINYHNQYYKAFEDVDLLNQTKKLWLNSLRRFTPESILKGARALLEQSEFLPTLHQMLVACENASRDGALPDVHAAYLEACRAPSPKAAQSWSHPLVYHAGTASDWYFLATSPEAVAFPVFRRHYERLQRALVQGETLELPATAPTRPQVVRQPLNGSEASARAEQLRALLDSGTKE